MKKYPAKLSHITSILFTLQQMFYVYNLYFSHPFSGPFTTLGGVETLGFIHTKYVNVSEDFPDVEIHFVSGSHVSDGGQTFQRVMGVSQQVQFFMYEI